MATSGQDRRVDRRLVTTLQYVAAGGGSVRFQRSVSTPPGYEVEPERAGSTGTDHYEVFADRWKHSRGSTSSPPTSGPAWLEAEDAERKRDLEDWQVDGDMMRAARKDALFMHAFRSTGGEEVRGEVIDAPQERRVGRGTRTPHTQKA